MTTPFYRTIIDLGNQAEVPGPESNYEPYDLFCLKTKIGVQLADLSITDQPIFATEFLNGRMVVTLKLRRGDRNIDLDDSTLDQLQRMVDTSVSYYPKHCILFSTSSCRLRYPRAWILSIFQYLPVPLENNVFISGENMYAQLGPDYFDMYQTLNHRIHAKLEELYQTGSVVCSRELATQWELELAPSLSFEELTTDSIRRFVKGTDLDFLGDDSAVEDSSAIMTNRLQLSKMTDLSREEDSHGTGLYLATWTDSRFASPITDFLLSRVSGVNTIRLWIGESNVSRHRFVESLDNETPVFEDAYALIPASSLTQARRYASLAEKSRLSGPGKVVTIPLSTDKLGPDYQQAVTNLLPESEMVMYRVEDPTRPYIASVEIGYLGDILMTTATLNEMAITRSREQLRKKNA